MKVFIKECCRDVIVRIYGTDGDEHTQEFFERYFKNVEGVYETTEEEHKEYNSEAAFTITKSDYYDFLAQQLENIQKGIDEVAEALARGSDIEQYIFDGCCYVI